uniref:SCA7 domain-containing protein n=1 Tax=Biomphalaria glabrata TaxID=6526 RepID=A0A2C9KNY9_BIOGL
MATQDSSPSLIIGQQWSALADLLSSNRENDEDESDKDGNKNSSDSMKLGRQDMGLFGFCPARDEFSLVVCEKCNLLVKPQALKQHIESRHGPTNLSSLGNIPASALNSELGKKLLMPLPSKTPPPPPPTTKSLSRPSSGTFKPVTSGRPSKASLKQVPAAAAAKNIAAPRLGVSMKISPMKSVKAGNRITPTTTTATTISNPVVKVEKLEKVTKGSGGPDENSEMPATAPVSIPHKDSSKISTLINGSIKSAISLTTPSSLPTTTSSAVFSTPTCIAVTKSWTDTHLSTRSVTTFVTTTAGTKPLMIAPVMTIGSAGIVTARPITSAKTSKSAKDQKERKFLPCKDREYDANKHCGVKIVETGKPCTRSLTCKTHALSLRRAVPGRSKSFDDLLKEHKAAKDALLKAKAESQNAAAAANAASSANRVLVNSSTVNTTLSSLKQQQMSPVIVHRDSKLGQISGVTVTTPRAMVPSAGLPANTTFAKAKNVPSVFQRFTSTALLPSVITVKEESMVKQEVAARLSSSSTGEPLRPTVQDKKPDQSYLSHHPKPLAVCQFGGRLNDRGCFLFCRKMDYVRAAFLSALERQLNPPPHKKLCVESNLPRDTQTANSSQDPYEFNMFDSSGASMNKNSSLFNVAKPNIKPKSSLSTSPLAASTNPLSFTTVSLTPMSVAASMSLPSSLAVSASPISVSSVTPSSLALNWSVKTKDGLNSRSPSASPLPSVSSASVINPGKRKRSGSNGNTAGQLVAVASGNGTLPVIPSVSLAMSTASITGAMSQQSGLTGIITPSSLNSHHTGNLIAIPSVNLNSAYLGQLNATTMGGAKISASGAGIVAGTAHKNNNMFKDINLVLTGLDSINGQLVNITSAQLAELGLGQGQTIYINNNFTPSSTSASGTTGSAPVLAAKRSRTSKSHQPLNKPASNRIPVVEGFKLIPSSSVITSSGLPPNAVLMDSSSLQGAVLTSVAMAPGCTTPTLVAIPSSTANSNSNTVSGNPSQLICVDSSSGQITSSALVNGIAQSYEKSGSSSQRHHTSSKSHHHQQQQQLGKNPQQQTLAIGNVLQAMPISSGSATQLCSNQALLKQGFNLTKGGVSLTFPLNVSQTGLALAAGKPQQQQQHTLLVATSGAAVGDGGGKTDVH